MDLPVDKTEFVYSLDGKNNLCDVEARDILGEDFILDQHRHQIATRQELHEHVKEVGVLEGGIKLHNPGAVGLGQDISFGAHVSELVLLEHFRLDQGLHGVHLAIGLLLNKLDFSEGTLSNDLDSVVVFRLVLCSQEAQVLTFFTTVSGPELLSTRWGLAGILELLLEFALPIEYKDRAKLAYSVRGS